MTEYNMEPCLRELPKVHPVSGVAVLFLGALQNHAPINLAQPSPHTVSFFPQETGDSRILPETPIRP